jgi:FLYWCH zinc finger domain
VLPAEFYQTDRGTYLYLNGYFFVKNTLSQNSLSWRCTLHRSYKCKARARVDISSTAQAVVGWGYHTHGSEEQKSIRRQKLVKKTLMWRKDRPTDSNNPSFV